MRPDALLAPPLGGATPAVARAGGPTLTRRASLNALQGLLDYAAGLVVWLVVTPVLVRGLGQALFGVWQVLHHLAGYTSTTDGRPSAALRLVVASHQASDDEAAKRRFVGGALVVWLLFLPLVTLVGAVAVWLAPSLVAAGPAAPGTVRLTCALLVASFAVMTLAQVPEGVLRGMNLGYRRMGLQATLHAVGGALMVAALVSGGGLVGLGAAQVALWACTGLCFWFLTRRYVPWFGAARPRRAEVRLLVGTSVWLALGDLIAKLLLASDVIIIGALVAPAAVTAYVLTGYAARTAIGVLVFAVDATMPGLGGLLGAGERDRATALRRELLALTWLFVTTVGCTILLWNPAFVTLWIGADAYAGFWVNLLLVLVAVQTAFIRCDAYLIDAGLRPRARVVVGAVAAAVTIAAAVALTGVLGIPGTCLGVLLGRAVQAVAYPLVVRRLLAGPAPDLRGLLRPAAAAALLLGAAALAGEQLRPAGWAPWAGAVLLTLPLVAALAFHAGLSGPLRAAVRARGRAVVLGLRRG